MDVLELWQKGKVFPVHAMKAYRRNAGRAPLILNLGTRWRWLLYPWERALPHPLKRKLHGSQKQVAPQITQPIA
jgi:hypothetical protein